MVVEVFLGVGAAVAASLRNRSFIDSALRVTTAAAVSVPVFVVGLALQQSFAIRWHLLPLRSAEGGVRALILPALTLGSLHAGVVARLVRTSMRDVGEADYVRTARAKGLSNRAVLVRHQLRSAMLPVVTYLGIGFGALLGGAVITETIFNRDGLGLATVNAIRGHDNPIIVAVTMYSVVAFVLVNLVVDLSYPFLDPRVRLGPGSRAGT
jgi:oligopeptide transport system permease protein